jgi:recombination DNA repair RAD52 pathway protein
VLKSISSPAFSLKGFGSSQNSMLYDHRYLDAVDLMKVKSPSIKDFKAREALYVTQIMRL